MAAMVLRRIVLRGATGATIRTATFDNREHVVVPVVALVEGVIHAINAPNAEFVPAEVLEFAPGGWNGRAVTYDHPNNGVTQISANDPRTLEANCFGQLFNTTAADGKLMTEAWLDPAKAAKVGEGAENVIARARAGEAIEVSVGALVETVNVSGEHKGRRYASAWKTIIPDHLAMLPEGATGACSNEMGCGVRNARAYLVTAEGLVEQNSEGTEMNPSLRERLLRMINGAFRAETADTDLRRLLDNALRQAVPAYYGLETVDPDEKYVIYVREAANGGIEFLKRTFKKKEDSVTLNDDEVAVEMITEFQEVGRAASEKPADKPSGCGCGGHATRTAETATQTEESSVDKTKVVNDLIASGKFKETDRAWLEASPDEALTALSAAAPTTTEAPAATSGTETPAEQVQSGAEAAPETVDQYIEKAPEALREVLKDGLKAAAARKTGLITQIRAAQGCPFSEVELKAKTTEELEKLARFAGVKMDYSGRSLAAAEVTGEPEEIEAPQGVGPAIRAAAAAKK